jgi:benzoyl-CoA-dihydrodiol lyase
LEIDGAVATLTMAVREDEPFRPGYQLKLNSYDLGVDIELADAVQRLRLEHPEVRCVVISSALDRMFCAGANIKMLATSDHGFKVNFCKFTNETRCAIEDATVNSSQRYIAALNGTASGGGYELAMACDEIYIVDDGSSAVSLPEVPLLAVLPGTGGLTRLVDKRRVRRDIADLFCTTAEGFKARNAVRHCLVDAAFPRSRWQESISERTRLAVDATGGPGDERGIVLEPLDKELDGHEHRWRHVTLSIGDDGRRADLVIHGPDIDPPADHDALHAAGGSWDLAAFRELDAALLELRFNYPEVGLVLLRTRGSGENVLAHDRAIADLEAGGSWLAREIRLHQARTLRRLDNTAKSLFAVIDEGSCFAGSLFEVALAADRSYMLAGEDELVSVRLGTSNAGALPQASGKTRLEARFPGRPSHVEQLIAATGAIPAEEAFDLGLVTSAPDDIDWEDELRIAVEERLSMSPDALTGMEQNLRFVGAESCDNKIFGRLSAWQNWIFQRPNAVGERGALTVYGRPERPQFDMRRT